MRSLALVGLLAATLGACGADDPAPAATPPAAIYTVRGEVADLPGPGRPLDWVALRHEAIPDFVGITGEPDPMSAMTMRFPVADGVDVGGLAPGDKVTFELEVDWSSADPARVVALEALPAEIELDHGAP